jgi:hypothetical protein
MQHARQRDELGVAVWKLGQPENCDDQAHPEKFLFLLHMYIGAAVSETFLYLLPLFVYSIPLASTCWEYSCVDEVACLLVLVCPTYIYMYCQYLSVLSSSCVLCDGELVRVQELL